MKFPAHAETVLACSDPRLAEAVRYVLENPGKQLRARLVHAAYGVFKQEAHQGLDTVATAIEWLHAYSLVHDDLPAMDDDAVRRGRPTVHMAFDEATAILVGDGLQAAAMSLLAQDDSLPETTRLRLITLIAGAVGLGGMVGGQALDMSGEGQALDIEDLQLIHRQKTGALIRAAVLGGALCANASETDIDRLGRYAAAVGLGFQIADDVLDVTESSSTLGKTAGKDADVGKSTYVSTLGLTGAQAAAESQLEEAVDCLRPYGEAAGELRALASAMIRRNH